MKKFILLIILLIPIKLFAPNDFTYKGRMKLMMENEIINNNLIRLKDNSIKTRKEVFKLAQETIEIYLNRGNYKQYFPNLQDSISYGLACIFVSESSNTLGQSARSSLWLNHNNPFGLTSNRGTKLLSWELINGEKVIMYRTFQTFTSFQQAIDYLMINCLLKQRFSKAVNSCYIKDFLYGLYEGYFMSNSKWPTWAYNQIYLKYV